MKYALYLQYRFEVVIFNSFPKRGYLNSLIKLKFRNVEMNSVPVEYCRRVVFCRVIYYRGKLFKTISQRFIAM